MVAVRCWLVAMWMVLASPARAEVPATGRVPVCAEHVPAPSGSWTAREWNEAVEAGRYPKTLVPMSWHRRGTVVRSATWVADGRRVSWRSARYAFAANPASAKLYRDLARIEEQNAGLNGVIGLSRLLGPEDTVWTGEPGLDLILLPYNAAVTADWLVNLPSDVAEQVDGMAEGQVAVRSSLHRLVCLYHLR